MLIWWLTEVELKIIHQNGYPKGLPEWLVTELSSAYGRNGRGRLWVSPELGPIDTTLNCPAENLHIVANHAGLVFPDHLLPLMAGQPGLVTDLQMKVWRTSLDSCFQPGDLVLVTDGPRKGQVTTVTSHLKEEQGWLVHDLDLVSRYGVVVSAPPQWLQHTATLSRWERLLSESLV